MPLVFALVNLRLHYKVKNVDNIDICIFDKSFSMDCITLS